MDATTRTQERQLFARLRAEPGQASRERVFRHYLPLAHRLAARYRNSGEPLEDLEQVAGIGLLKAIDRFDPERATAFSTFAVPTILGELRRHFRDSTWALRVPRELQELTLRIDRARDDLTAALGRAPTISELSGRLGVAQEQILQALELALAQHAVSLDEPGPAEHAGAPGSLDEGYDRAEDRALVGPLLATLSARDAEIVLLRFRDDLTQDAIAGRVGVSQMHVSRVLHRSLLKLRDAAGPARTA